MCTSVISPFLFSLLSSGLYSLSFFSCLPLHLSPFLTSSYFFDFVILFLSSLLFYPLSFFLVPLPYFFFLSVFLCFLLLFSFCLSFFLSFPPLSTPLLCSPPLLSLPPLLVLLPPSVTLFPQLLSLPSLYQFSVLLHLLSIISSVSFPILTLFLSALFPCFQVTLVSFSFTCVISSFLLHSSPLICFLSSTFLSSDGTPSVLLLDWLPRVAGAARAAPRPAG